MRYILSFFIVLTFSYHSFAQKVFSTKYENQADVKVFVVEYENQAKGNEGKWFFTKYSNQAKKKVFC